MESDLQLPVLEQQPMQEHAQESGTAHVYGCNARGQTTINGLTEAEIIGYALDFLHRGLERGEYVADPTRAGSYFTAKLRAREREVFAALFLDTRHRLLRYDELFFGTIDGAEVHPREVARVALQCNAAAVLIAHNHPSGNPEPSAADRAVTSRLKQALALIDVRLLDHFVIGDGPAVSMAARGWV